LKEYIYTYRKLAERLYNALIPDPFYYTLENQVDGNSAARKEAMLRYFDYSMIESENYGCLFIPSEHNHGASVWSKPVSNVIEQEMKIKKKKFLLDYLGQEAFDCYVAITEFMQEQVVDMVPSVSWYLSIVGLNPAFQNKGLGSGLINPILEKSDEQNVSTYLETFTPRNMKFYKRLGFTSIGSCKEPVTNSEYWIMLRSPN
jgi:GNAT superfamily N-acetyltransferase